MNKATVAEFVLRVVIDRESARTIAGDLIETYSRNKGFSFWLSLLQLFGAFVWKPLLGLAVAMLVWFVVDSELLFALVRVFRINPLPPITLSHGVRLVRASADLSALGTFALVAYGLRDRLWMMSAVCAAMTAALAFSFWVLSMQLLLWFVLSAAIVMSLRIKEMRRNLGIIVASFTSSLMIGLLSELALQSTHPNGFRQAMLVWIIPSTLGPPFVAAVVCGWVRPHGVKQGR